MPEERHLSFGEIREAAHRLAEQRRTARAQFQRYSTEAAEREHAFRKSLAISYAQHREEGCGAVGDKWELHLPSVETFRKLKALYGLSGTALGPFEPDNPRRGSAESDEWDWFIEWAEAERERIGLSPDSAERTSGGMFVGEGEGERPITAPATPEAAQWQGWGTALKPAHEPMVVARKPLSGTVAQNVTEHSQEMALRREANLGAKWTGDQLRSVINWFEEDIKGKDRGVFWDGFSDDVPADMTDLIPGTGT